MILPVAKTSRNENTKRNPEHAITVNTRPIGGRCSAMISFETGVLPCFLISSFDPEVFALEAFVELAFFACFEDFPILSLVFLFILIQEEGQLVQVLR